MSNKTRILEAAVLVAERDGIRGVTLESVAEAADLTKGGVQYHFGSKEDLMGAVEHDIWRRVDGAAAAALGKPVGEATPDERLEALIRSSEHQGVRLGQLLLVLDSARDGGLSVDGDAFFARWTGADTRPLNRWKWIALLASDGLWLHDAINDDELTGDTRREVLDGIVELALR